LRIKHKVDTKENMWDKLEIELQLKQALAFINPELDDEQIFIQTHLLLLNLVSVKEFKKTLNLTRDVADKKLDEVKSLYQQFALTTNETDN
jgi:hypothetical protein